MNTVTLAVVGAPGVGKSYWLNRLAFSDMKTDAVVSMAVGNVVYKVHQQSELGPLPVGVDVAIVMYSLMDPGSETVAEEWLKLLSGTVPCVLVANKVDTASREKPDTFHDTAYAFIQKMAQQYQVKYYCYISAKSMYQYSKPLESVKKILCIH